MKRALLVCMVIAGTAAMCTPSGAKDVNFEAAVDRNFVSIGESVRMGLTFYGTQDVPAPEITSLGGFQVRYIGPSKIMSITNGRVTSSVTHNYMLLPLKVGNFDLGPFTFDYRGDRYISNKVPIKVIEESQAQGGGPGGGARGAQAPDLSDRLFLVLSVGKTTAYLNELIPVSIKLYINRLPVRNIQYPTFAQEGFSKAEFGEPKQYREVLRGVTYDVVEFATQIFGTKTGEFKIGPAEANCTLEVRRPQARQRSPFEDDYSGFNDPFFDEFFSQHEVYPTSVKSKDLGITITPLPSEGVPKDFGGTVGDFQFVFDARPRQVKAGDPITLEMSIYGSGNFNTVSPPKLEDTAGFKVYEPQSRMEEKHRVFEQAIIPESEDVKAIPKVSFSYFNPTLGEYKTITHGPTPITVEKLPEAARPKIVESAVALGTGRSPTREVLGRDIIYIKDSFGRARRRGEALYKNRVFLALQLLPLLLLLAVIIVHSRAERLKKDVKYARLVKAPKTARQGLARARRCVRAEKVGEFYDEVYSTLRSYLGDRFQLPTGGITVQIIDEVLVPRGYDEEMLKKLKGLFEDCDLARYAPSGMSQERMRSSMETLQEIIAYFERAKL